MRLWLSLLSQIIHRVHFHRKICFVVHFRSKHTYAVSEYSWPLMMMIVRCPHYWPEAIGSCTSCILTSIIQATLELRGPSFPWEGLLPHHRLCKHDPTRHLSTAGSVRAIHCFHPGLLHRSIRVRPFDHSRSMRCATSYSYLYGCLSSAFAQNRQSSGRIQGRGISSDERDFRVDPCRRCFWCRRPTGEKTCHVD